MFKAKGALDAIKGGKTLAELVKLHDVYPNQIVDWKNQLLERVGNDTNFLAAGLIGDDVIEEGHELGPGVTRGVLAEHFADLGVEAAYSESVPCR